MKKAKSTKRKPAAKKRKPTTRPRRRRFNPAFRHRFDPLSAPRETVSLPLSLRKLSKKYLPAKRWSTPDWAAEHIRIPAEFAATVGRYDLDRYPFWRELLEAIDDTTTEKIIVMAATQIGKTEWLKAAMVASSQASPAPAMLAGPDKDYVSELRDKIYALADASPALRDRVPRKHLRNYRWIDLGGAFTYLAWSGSPQRLSGKACKRVFCSEVDRWTQNEKEGATQGLVAERVKAFALYKIVFESTPTNEKSPIAALFYSGDQRRYHVPCPHCGHYQELRFFPHRDGPYKGLGGVVGIKNGDGKYKTPDAAIESAYYLCEQGCRIENHQKGGMIGRGVWCPHGQTVSPKGNLTGKPTYGSRVRSYHLSSLYSPQISFGRFAAKYLEVRGDQEELRGFWNNWLGLPFRVTTEIPQWRELGRRNEAGHRRGTVPTAAVFLTAGVDKQKDRCYYVVRGWGTGSRSWLVDWGVCAERIGEDGLALKNSDLEEMARRIIHRRFPTVDEQPGGVTSLPVVLCGVDTGYEPAQVWDFVRGFGGDLVRAVAGDTRMASEFYRRTLVEKNARTGKPYPGGLERWGINVDNYKTDVQNRWRLSPGEAAAWLFPKGIAELGEEYLRQITNEGAIWEHNKAGRLVKAWRVINPKEGNHYWDCEIYARACADMWSGGQWDQVTHEAALRQQIDADRRASTQSKGLRTPDGRPYLITNR